PTFFVVLVTHANIGIFINRAGDGNIFHLIPTLGF
ncbi:MAG: hypothetical protein ACI9KM_002636, partial [Rubritalea sp.]